MTEKTSFPYRLGELLTCKPGHDQHDRRTRYRVDKIFDDTGITLTYRYSNNRSEQIYLRPFMLIYGIYSEAFSVSGIEETRWRNFHQSFVTEIIAENGRIFENFDKWVGEFAPELLDLANATRSPDPPLFQIEIKIS